MPEIPDGVWYPIGTEPLLALEFTQGSTISFSVHYQDLDVDHDLTYDTFSVYAASNPELELNAQFIVEDPLTGRVVVVIPAEAIADLPVGDYWIDIASTYVDLQVITTGHIPLRISNDGDQCS